MFTTSATTFVSFISNASSLFPAIATFGMFCASLIVCNFAAVTTFWPACWMVHVTQIKGKYAFDTPSRWFSGCKPAEAEVDGAEKAPEKEGRLQTFFESTWGELVVNARYGIIVLFTGVFVGALLLAMQLEPDQVVE